jgi:hypothetical protein
MDTWVVHIMNAGGSSRITVTEVAALDIVQAVGYACAQTNLEQSAVISAKLKAPIVID